MIKRVSLVARKAGMSLKEFENHWTGPHIEVVRTLKNLRGIRVNLVSAVDGEQEWDGIGELWFDTIEDARAAFLAEPTRTRLLEDRANFLGRSQIYYVTERVIVAPPI